jgi:prepilin-type N-terminal cleavage/methylation domain-containing protein
MSSTSSGLRAGLGAFTMLEMLLVLALIGLLTTVAVKGISNMLSNGPPTAKEAFGQMMAAARRYALSNECEVRMTFSAEKQEMDAVAADGTEIPAIPMPAGAAVTFLPIQSTNASGGASGGVFDAIAGQGASTDLPYVTFYDDGTCTMFQAHITTNIGAPLTLSIDPWTAGQMLTQIQVQ